MRGHPRILNWRGGIEKKNQIYKRIKNKKIKRKRIKFEKITNHNYRSKYKIENILKFD